MKEYQSLCHTKWDCKYHIGLYPEEAEKNDILSDPKASRRDIEGVGGAERMSDSRRAFDGGSRTYLHQHSAKALGVICD